MREAQLEAACRQWSKERGWLCYKLVSPGKRGFPDRMFVRAGRIVFVEFKTSKGRLSVHQARRVDELVEAGAEVHVIDSFDDFVEAMGES